ncbi:hypothetical protein [Desulfobacula sp.]
MSNNDYDIGIIGGGAAGLTITSAFLPHKYHIGDECHDCIFKKIYF